MFLVQSYKKRFDANKVTILPKGEYPYIVRMGSNNGQKGFINEDPKYLNEGNTISFGQDTATMYYQEKPYFTGDKIKILKPKCKEFNKNNAHFFLVAMSQSFRSFSWGRSSFNVSVIENQLLKLPVKNGSIDFGFMENFIAELEAQRITELEAYLSVTGLKDTNLSPEEEQALKDLPNIEFKDYKLTDIFNVKNTGNILSRDIIENSGTTPYLCASAENNAVASYISYNENCKNKGNCIFIGGKTFVVTYQEYDFFSNDSHNIALYLKNAEYQTKLDQLYLATCVYKSLCHKYSWGDSISNKKAQKDYISLPTKGGVVDFKSMSILILAVQKLVIKDVVSYSGSKINATKSSVNE